MAKSEHLHLTGCTAANAIPPPVKTANNAEPGVKKRTRLNSQCINQIIICENSQMAGAKVTWGEKRMADKRKWKRGLRVSPPTVGKYRKQAAPDPQQGWLPFLRNHAQAIVACDFCAVGHGHLPHPVRVGVQGGACSPPNRASHSGRGPAAVAGGAAGRSLPVPDP
jgi:hypothetical protein